MERWSKPLYVITLGTEGDWLHKPNDANKQMFYFNKVKV